MPAPQEVTVATINTQFGRTLRAEDGLVSVKDADIILLQEVVNPEQESLSDRLKEHGFDLIAAAGQYGLAIALRSESRHLEPVPGSEREELLQRMVIVEAAALQKRAGRPHGFRERGLLSACFETAGGQKLTVANTHLSIPTLQGSRNEQLAALGEFLTTADDGASFVLGGDMNHYRGPGLRDQQLRDEAGLTRVDTGGEPTWRAKGSDHAVWMGPVATISRRPIAHFDGDHDTIMFRGEGLEEVETTVVDIPSDHRAILTKFRLDLVPAYALAVP